MIEGSILVVDDDRDVLLAAKLLLKRHFSAVHTASTPADMWQLLQKVAPLALLLDMNFVLGQNAGQEGLDALTRIRQLDTHVAVVLTTAYGDIDLAVAAMKRGATDFVLKPWQNDKMVATLQAAAQLCAAQREAACLRSRNRELETHLATAQASPMVGHSLAAQRVERLIDKAAPSAASVLILGENGTGKELVARELHRRSLRAAGPFVAVDLGALAETLFESELFGHTKGAFTGAVTARSGRFLAANGGTIFLDEIGNIPLHLQAKLLTVLEQRQVVAVGADKPVPIDVRVVAATNLDRAALTDERRFRADLLYRLNTVEIALAPLRERRDDIAVLAAHYLRHFAQTYGHEPVRLEPAALKSLEDHPWPGNIRALRHSIERAMIMAEDGVIRQQDLDLPAFESSNAAGVTSTDETYDLESIEREAISRAMAKYGGNISQMAKALGLTRAALYRRLEKHGLS